MKRTLLAFFPLFVLMSACGNSSDSSTTCDAPFTPCGGDVVGTWKLVNACTSTSGNPLANSCPSGTVSTSTATSGQLVFGADGTYNAMITLTATELLKVPASCLTGATSCDALNDNLMRSDTFASTSCTGQVSDACTCTATTPPSTSGGSGAYTTMGNTISLIDAGETAPSQAGKDYCVQGGTLQIKIPSGDNTTVILIAQK